MAFSISGNDGIAFSAYATSGTSLTAATTTKVNFQSELFDTRGLYDAANSRFQPDVAGFYQINAKVRADIASNVILASYIFKNGSGYKEGGFKNNTSSQQGGLVSGLVYLNGTTDYVEIHAYTGSAGTTNASGSTETWFDGHLVFGYEL